MKNLKRILFAAIIISAATLTSCKDDEEASLKCLQCEDQQAICEGDEVDGQTITRADLEETLSQLDALSAAFGVDSGCSLVDQ